MTQHHFTVDVEEYFHASAFERVIDRSEWDGLERRSADAVRRLLDLMARHDATGTFFVLGWVAERDPDLVKAIAAAGHEVASHGWDHRRVTQQAPHQFRESVRDSKRLLEDTTGQRVRGFRAPSYSIVPGLEWALDVLLEEGYSYDSSLFPIWRPDGYGYACGEARPPLARASQRSAGRSSADHLAPVWNLPAGGRWSLLPSVPLRIRALGILGV